MTRARIPAAMLRELNDLRNPKTTSIGRYLVVPKVVYDIDQWSAMAMAQQSKLVADVRN